MTTAMKAAILGPLTAVMILSCFGGYQLYQRRYLSSDLKRTLIAAMDPAVTENDIVAYLHDARLQVRTRKDAEILQKFETTIQFAKDASEINNRLFNERMKSIDDMTSRNTHFDKLVAIAQDYQKSGIVIPKDLLAQIHQARIDDKAEHDQQRSRWDADEQRAKDEATGAKKLYGEVRSELGLPPVPLP
jgi:hypothetical protein